MAGRQKCLVGLLNEVFLADKLVFHKISAND